MHLFTRKIDRVEFIRSSKDMWRNLIQIVRINRNINMDCKECEIDKVVKKMNLRTQQVESI